MTERAGERLQKIFSAKCARDLSVRIVAASRPLSHWPAGAWHKHLYKRSCNQSAAEPVMSYGVDALLITWMILTQARWLRLRFKMTMKQLARWCDSFIHWLPKSSVHIDRAEPRRKISAK